MNNKKTKIAIISVIALLLLLIGVTYAYWLVTKTQTNSNIISSACLDITLDNETNDISLSSQYPMSDEDGMKLTPYTFTVTNNCNTSIDYQVALESIGNEETSISSSAIKVALDDSAKLYSNYGKVATTINGTYESRSIGYARLAANGNEGSSVTHSLRIWIDENAPISEANKTFQSKISVTIGQGIDSPYEAETLAYDILANNGGAGVSEINATEKADRITLPGNIYIGTSSNYYYGTEYTLDESTGKYTLSGEVVQAKLSECRDGSKTCGKYTLIQTTSTATNATLYEVTDFKTSGNYISVNRKKYTTPFGATETNPSLNKAQDDIGTSYYFRGDVTNNYVQFGYYDVGTNLGKKEIETASYSFVYYDEEGMYIDKVSFDTLEECEVEKSKYEYVDRSCSKQTIIKEIDYILDEQKPMFWRIVRINGDGTIRLVYDGIEKVENGIKHTASVGGTMYNELEEVKYLGYTYDTSETDLTQVDSTIKTYLDGWYSSHLKTKYGIYIADEVFCNDKELIYGYYYDENYEPTTDKNLIVFIDEYYGSYERLMNKKAPSLICRNKLDRYTMNTDRGNGYLNNPVGLLTADEVVFAGGSNRDPNNIYYLYSGESFWTMTPSSIVSEGPTPYMYNWSLFDTGSLGEEEINVFNVVRPVINLRADIEFTGNGSLETPYVIKTN